ncbi:hypothetical protein ACQEVS_10095 [Streptomyces sp. CA-181903]|uniref:hypothetical protein n=1 Tax=Streptomyces sp. CA-181903 TaxID=3240055 RepID=UPI003D8F2A7C
MTEQPQIMSAEQAGALVGGALADDGLDLAVPLALSLALREGLPNRVLSGLSRGDYHPAVDGVPGSLTYRDGDQVRVVALSPQSELLLSGYLSASA